MSRSGRITRYLLRELATPTLLGLLLFTFVLLMNHFFLVAEKALTKNLGAELTLRLFAVGIPKLLVLSLPMSVLFGTLIALGRLSADQEWVALQSAGRGISVVLKPVLIHGLLGALASFLIYAVVVPRSNYSLRNLRGEVLFSSNLAADLRPRVFYDLQNNATVFVDEIRPGGQRRLENLIFIQPDPQSGLTQLVMARYGDLYPASDRSGALIVDFYDGQMHYFQSDDPEKYQVGAYEIIEGHRLAPPRFIQSLLTPPDKVAQDFSLPELWYELRQARAERDALFAAPGDAASSKGRRMMAERRLSTATVELHQRLALPLASFVFALLALPLGITSARSGKGAGFALSVVVILVYRVVFVLARNQAINGKIPAEVGPWIANAVILIWAALAFWRLRRGALPRAASGESLPSRVLTRIRGLLAQRRRAANGFADDGADFAALGGTPRRFVARLDRYIGLAYLRVLLFALTAFYLIYGLVELQELMDSALRTKQPLTLVLTYFPYFAPSVLHVVLPVSCLVGSIVAFTLLSRSSEIVAVKASGVSARRATFPVLILTLAFCGLLFLVQDRIAPATSRKAQEIKDLILKRAPRTHGVPFAGAWTFGPDGTTLYHYKLYDPDHEEFRGLSAFTLDRSVPRVLDHRYAERARWAGEGWELERGWYRTFERAPDGSVAGSSLERFFGKRLVQLDLPSEFFRERRRIRAGGDDLPEQMSISELRGQIRNLEKSGYDITTLRVAYYGKYARALAPLVMVLLGLPFAFKVGRRGSLYGIGVALLLVLVYWATFAVFNALGLETHLRPYVAAWAPNVLYGILGVYLMLYVKT